MLLLQAFIGSVAPATVGNLNSQVRNLLICLLHWIINSIMDKIKYSLILLAVCNAGDPGLIPGLGRSPAEGNGYPLQYSCLENPMDRGAW